MSKDVKRWLWLFGAFGSVFVLAIGFTIQRNQPDHEPAPEIMAISPWASPEYLIIALLLVVLAFATTSTVLLLIYMGFPRSHRN